MWIWLAIGSAVMLGFYDVAKKQSLKRNSSLMILLLATAFTTLFLSPKLIISHGQFSDHLYLIVKAVLVSISWISGMAALKRLPITTASTIKASRPVFVLLFSIILFAERLNFWQWAGSIIAIVALYMLSRSSKKEGIEFTKNRGIAYMAISVVSGVASALYDKYIMQFLDPLFVQSWCNLYITLLLGIIVLCTWMKDKEHFQHLEWDWTILLIAVLITIADYLYFVSLSKDGAMLSVISMIRRSSVVFSFACGAVLFKEGNLKSKTIDLMVLLAGMALIVFGTC